MRLFIFLLFWALLADVAMSAETQSLESIRWMLGDWSRAKEKTENRESWKDTGAGVFKGVGSVVSREDGKVLSKESLLLVEMSGEVFYLAKVKENARPIAFKLTEYSASHAVFENPDHDFPKRLEYRLGEADRMEVKVSDGAKRGFVIPFSKSVRK